MSDLIERLRERADDMEFATSLDAEAAAQLEAQQAEIARLREVLTKCHDTLHECTAVLTANDCATVAGVMAEARESLEQKP